MPDEKGRKLNGETLAAATTAAIWLLACSVGDGAAGGGTSCDRDEALPLAAVPPTPKLTPPPPPDPPDTLTLVSLGKLTAAELAAAVGECFLAGLGQLLPVLLLLLDDLRPELGAEVLAPDPGPAPVPAGVDELLPPS